MSRPTWARTWLAAARQVAKRSLCENSQVAAFVVSADNAFQWVGYNGPPRGFKTDDKTCSHWCPRAMSAKGSGTADYSACESLHAEDNVLLKADPTLRAGGAIYITRAPCINCARKIANSGLAVVAFEVVEEDDPIRTDKTVQYLLACGLEVLRLHPEKEAA